MNGFYTENLADFGFREISLVHDLLDAWLRYGLPEHFANDRVRPAMNIVNERVLLKNHHGQIALLNGKRLDIYYILPYGGGEGFLSKLVEKYVPAQLHEDDVAYIRNVAAATSFNLPAEWQMLGTDIA